MEKNSTMFEHIQAQLSELEHRLDIRVLYAVESGSRAWGFASADSDWDVRFIYIHRPEWYLDIEHHRDSIEKMLPKDLDLSGWELRKALRLFRKSNPPLLEWLDSPIVYHQQGNAAARLRELTPEYFSPKSCLHHYINMAENTYRTYLQREQVSLKKYFYALRPILACEWIRSIGTPAPILFRSLLDAQLQDAALMEEVERLLVRKTAAEEMKAEPPILLLNEYIVERIAFFRDYIAALPPAAAPHTGPLNALFREVLDGIW